MLSENLVMLRNLKGLTQEQVAEVVEISRQSYAKWEQGETVPDIEKCDRLASFYGIKLDALMHYDEKVRNTKMAPPPEGKIFMGNGKAGQSRTDRNSERSERQVWIAGGLPAGGIGQ